MKIFSVLILLTAIVQTSGMAAPIQSAATASAAPDLDLRVHYYNKVLTPEGVTREASYEETLSRRPRHVLIARVLPKNVSDIHDDDAKGTQHKHFNHVLIPRHIFLDNQKTRIEFIDTAHKEVIAIPASEYSNVNFDGSWENAFYLLDPQLVKSIPLSSRTSAVPGARWRERENNANFQRILWDEQKQIPLIVESGDKAGTFFRRMEVRLQNTLRGDLPWLNTKGYAQKEYADFLD
ncbi:hypothetical protein [Undibacterium oligocarboniphilum]|nr:hypothetical protein [Undibacterium oligocarboniphilum]